MKNLPPPLTVSLKTALLVFATLTLLFGVGSCKKDKIFISDTNSAFRTVDTTDYCIELGTRDTANDPFALVYEFLQYHQGFVEPEDLLEDSIQQHVFSMLGEIDQKYSSGNLSSDLDQMIYDGLITSYSKNKILDLKSTLSDVNVSNISAKISLVESDIQLIMQDSTEYCIERVYNYALYSSIKHALRYYEDAVQLNSFTGNTASLRNCDLDDYINCIFTADDLLKYAFGGALVGCVLENIFEGGQDAGEGNPDGYLGSYQEFVVYDQGSLSWELWCISNNILSNTTGTAIGAGLGILIGILDDVINCHCPDCTPIQNYSYRFISCNPIANFRPNGYGDEMVSFHWSTENGTPSNTTTYPTDPTARLTQINASEYLTFEIDMVCTGLPNLDKFTSRNHDLYKEVLKA